MDLLLNLLSQETLRKFEKKNLEPNEDDEAEFYPFPS